jgi:hypothetical protein
VSASVRGSPRVRYRDIKPYDAPARLEELRGPPAGRIVLPINVYWGPNSEVDLDSESDVVKAYQATLREGRVVDQVGILNKDLLVQIWPALMLPVRLRELWENRFPELAARP